MTRQDYIFTSESVSEGHPDKVCDRISDAVLDAFIGEEPEARVACETFATTNRVVIGGEVGLSDATKLKDFMGRIDQIARACIKDIGYEQEKFHHETVEITNLLHEQSAHIAQGVDASENKDVRFCKIRFTIFQQTNSHAFPTTRETATDLPAYLESNTATKATLVVQHT